MLNVGTEADTNCHAVLYPSVLLPVLSCIKYMIKGNKSIHTYMGIVKNMLHPSYHSISENISEHYLAQSELFIDNLGQQNSKIITE